MKKAAFKDQASLVRDSVELVGGKLHGGNSGFHFARSQNRRIMVHPWIMVHGTRMDPTVQTGRRRKVDL